MFSTTPEQDIRALLPYKDMDNEPTVNILHWCGLSVGDWKRHGEYIVGEQHKDQLVKPDYEYEELLRNPPNVLETLRRIGFEQLYVLLTKRVIIVESLKNLQRTLIDAKKQRLLSADYDIEAESRLLWDHEQAHRVAAARYGIHAFLIFHPIFFESITIEVMFRVPDLLKAVIMGNDLAFILGDILAAPALQGTHHYIQEDTMAVELLLAAEQRSAPLTKEHAEYLLWHKERFYHSKSKTGTRTF